MRITIDRKHYGNHYRNHYRNHNKNLKLDIGDKKKETISQRKGKSHKPIFFSPLLVFNFFNIGIFLKHTHHIRFWTRIHLFKTSQCFQSYSHSLVFTNIYGHDVVLVIFLLFVIRNGVCFTRAVFWYHVMILSHKNPTIPLSFNYWLKGSEAEIK